MQIGRTGQSNDHETAIDTGGVNIMPVDITDIVRHCGVANHMATPDGQSHRERKCAEPGGAGHSEFRFHGALCRGPSQHGEEVNRYYQGTRYIDQIETMAREELLALTQCRQADVRPISGNAANTAIALGHLRGGDAIIVNSTPAGGHISHNTIGVFGRRIQVRGMSLNLMGQGPFRCITFRSPKTATTLTCPKASTSLTACLRVCWYSVKVSSCFLSRCVNSPRCVGKSRFRSCMTRPMSLG